MSKLTYIYKWGKSVRAFSNLSDSFEATMVGDTEVEALINIIKSPCVLYIKEKEGCNHRDTDRVTIRHPKHVFFDKPTSIIIIAGPNNDEYNSIMIDYLTKNPETHVDWLVTDSRFMNPPKWIKNIKIYSHLQAHKTLCDFNYLHSDYNFSKNGINKSEIVIVANQVVDDLNNSRWDRITQIADSLIDTEIILIGKWSDEVNHPNIRKIGQLKHIDMFDELRKYNVAIHLDNIKDRPVDTVFSSKLYELIMAGLIPFTESTCASVPSSFRHIKLAEHYLKNLTGIKLMKDRADIYNHITSLYSMHIHLADELNYGWRYS